MSLGNRLREERQRLNMVQMKFAELGGVGKQSQINYESGKRVPDAAYLAAISEHGADIAYIVTGQVVPAACDRPTNPAGHWAQRRAELLALDAEETTVRLPYAPQVKGAAERALARMERTGFAEADEVKIIRARFKNTVHRRSQTGWRDVEHICLPGWLMARALRRVSAHLAEAGANSHARLERWHERLSDREDLSRPARLLRSLAHWLTQSPNSARRSIPEQTSAEVSFPSMPDPLTGSGQGSPALDQKARK